MTLQLKIRGLYGLPIGTLNWDCYFCAAAGSLKTSCRSLAAVGNRNCNKGTIGVEPAEALRGYLTDLLTGQAPLKGIRNNDAFSHAFFTGSQH